MTTSSLSYEGDNVNIIYCEGGDASGFYSIKMLHLPALTVFNIILLGTEEQFVAERFSKHFYRILLECDRVKESKGMLSLTFSEFS